jgi:hypothetical protein
MLIAKLSQDDPEEKFPGCRHGNDSPHNPVSSLLRQRNESGDHPYRVDEATYDQFMSYFVFPTPEEGFNVVVHKT